MVKTPSTVPMHATEFLKSPPADVPGVVALSGEERSLKLSVIEAIAKNSLADEESPIRYPGKDADLQAVRTDLLTVPMWGGRRLVIIEDANDFVTDNRPALEAYTAKPAKKSILLLDLKSFPANTKLYKLVNANGLVIECSPLKAAALTRWVQDTAKRQHGKSLAANAAHLLVELAGTHLGNLEQELAKLASYAGEQSEIDIEAVRKLVGDWKTETTWAMTDAVRDGRLADALHAFDKLLRAGDPPLKIHGGIAFVFRKPAVATELARQGVPLSSALTQAGAWPSEVQSMTAYLRRIGRPKAERISRWLLEADLHLKGGSQLNDRTVLELLLMRLSGSVD